jgi:tight adherence protein C
MNESSMLVGAIAAGLAAALALAGAWVAVVESASSRLLRIASHEGSASKGNAASKAVETLGGWGPAHRLLGGNKAESLLERSGWRTSPEAFAGIRAVIGATGLFFVIITPWPGPLLSIFWCTAGVLAPLILAGRAAKRRLGDIDAEIPQLLDLLAAASSAGLSAPLALRRAADALTGPIVGELHRVLCAVDLGGRWRDELRAASDRLDLADFRRAVAVITRTETLGASLSRATSELAASVRQARRARATERARTAPVKMLLPLVFLVLPAFLLLTVVPVLLTTLQSFQ